MAGTGDETRRLGVLFAEVLRPLQRFFQLEAASGILLFVAAALALAWANSPWGPLYQQLLDTPLSLGAGDVQARFSVHALVNDGLMSVFFFVVGMEIKRELVAGELRTPAQAALPLVAALGGMVVPAGVYLAFNHGGPGQPGWAIPMATDIAFCIGLLTLLKGRVPHALVVFVTALAIFDDIGGILVIAFFYGSGLHAGSLLLALAVTLGLLVLNRLRVGWGPAYALGGAALWYFLHHGGIHATLSGVVLGLMIPARPRAPSRQVLAELHEHTGRLVRKPRDEALEDEEVLAIEEKMEDLEAPLQRFIHLLHPYVAFLIMPLFALANSGVSLQGMGLAELGSPVTLGSALGLFVGKQLGIFAFAWAAVKARLAPMPGDVSAMKLYGVSMVAGIGFTVALFIAALAFPTPPLLEQAKLGILLGSFVSGALGYALLRLTPSTQPAPGAAAGQPRHA